MTQAGTPSLLSHGRCEDVIRTESSGRALPGAGREGREGGVSSNFLQGMKQGSRGGVLEARPRAVGLGPSQESKVDDLTAVRGPDKWQLAEALEGFLGWSRESLWLTVKTWPSVAPSQRMFCWSERLFHLKYWVI